MKHLLNAKTPAITECFTAEKMLIFHRKRLTNNKGPTSRHNSDRNIMAEKADSQMNLGTLFSSQNPTAGKTERKILTIKSELIIPFDNFWLKCVLGYHYVSFFSSGSFRCLANLQRAPGVRLLLLLIVMSTHELTLRQHGWGRGKRFGVKRGRNFQTNF